MKGIWQFTKKFWWLLFIVVGVGVLIWRADVSAKEKEAKLKSYSVVRKTIKDELSLSGEIDAKEKATLRFQTSGKLAWVGVKEGEKIKKLQVVASLDKKDLQNKFQQLMNSYMKSRWDFEQEQDDNKNWQTAGMTDSARDAVKRSLDKYQFDLNNSVLAVESQDLTMKYANLFSPIAGVITKVDVPQTGINITPAGSEIEVVNPGTVFFSANADQTEVSKFYEGENGILKLDAFPDKDYQVMVERIGFTPKTGESGTVYELVLRIEGLTNENMMVRMGMTGDAQFVFKEYKDVLAVPSSYIMRDNGKPYVWEYISGKKIKVPVKIGETLDGEVIVLEGLQEKDVIYAN